MSRGLSEKRVREIIREMLREAKAAQQFGAMYDAKERRLVAAEDRATAAERRVKELESQLGALQESEACDD